MFSGFVWAGFNLGTSNYVYDACPSKDRIHCVVFYNFMNGMMAFLGATIGGFLINNMVPLFGSPILFVFLISSGDEVLASAMELLEN